MSIDAIVEGVSELADGTLKLHLGPNGDTGPGQSSLSISAGQTTLLRLSMMVGVKIWGGSSKILCGDGVIAEREGYTSLRLTPDWEQHMRRWWCIRFGTAQGQE